MMTKNAIHELLIAMEIEYQHLGANLVHFLDDGFDPDSYYTPCENAMYLVYEALGFNRYDIVREAYKRITEEAER